MNELTQATTIQNSQVRHWMKIRAIRVGSAVKYGALFSAVYALLTGIPSAIATIAIQRLVINLLAPVIKLFHGSVAGALSSATTITLWLLLFYVLAIMLFVCIFTALATLAYNLVARFTGGLTLELREVGLKRESGDPSINRGPTAEERSTVEEVGKKMEDEAPTINQGSTVEEGSAVEEVSKKMEDEASKINRADAINRVPTGEETPAATENPVSDEKASA
jgi:hypothetical protein